MTFSDRYMAPEVYRRESYGKSIDVFSFALIVHEVQLNDFFSFFLIWVSDPIFLRSINNFGIDSSWNAHLLQ